MLQVWTRPGRPAWMDEATYERMPPETLTIRLVRVVVNNPGYRSRVLVVATTLVDAQIYSSEDIGDLYHRRWHVEFDIRSIKQTMGMEELSCKTPGMARKEL